MVHCTTSSRRLPGSYGTIRSLSEAFRLICFTPTTFATFTPPLPARIVRGLLPVASRKGTRSSRHNFRFRSEFLETLFRYQCQYWLCIYPYEGIPTKGSRYVPDEPLLVKNWISYVLQISSICLMLYGTESRTTRLVYNSAGYAEK